MQRDRDELLRDIFRFDKGHERTKKTEPFYFGPNHIFIDRDICPASLEELRALIAAGAVQKDAR